MSKVRNVVADSRAGDRRSLRVIAYETLKQQIQTLELEPGTVASDVELASRLGMSRTPVREAITLLERDFLVTRDPNRGVLIRKLSTDEIMHILNMREALDGMAARLASKQMDAAHLDALQAEFETARQRTGGLQPQHHAELSRQLHSAIVSATGNPFLGSTLQTLMGAFEQSRQYSWRTWNHSRQAATISERRYEEHLAIIAAIRSRNPDAAEAAARSHVVNALRDTLNLLMR
ncbi:MAG: GntR family transcriptional regulator [Proteobacteria bacterium]|nr:GntR family transcriptional regulator [Pseudomonadota bacterium]